MNLYDEATLIDFEALPVEAQKLVEKSYLVKEEYEFQLKYIPYPKNTPIAFSHIEYDFGIDSGVESTHNLKAIDYVICFASGVTLYEKENSSEPAYALFKYEDYNYSDRYLIVIEI